MARDEARRQEGWPLKSLPVITADKKIADLEKRLAAAEALLDVATGLAAVSSLTDNTGGTNDSTLANIGASYSQTAIANNFADLAAKLNTVLARLRAAGVIET